MTEEVQQQETMSEEDKFFGVKTTFEKGKPVKADDGLEIEYVDDRPPEDRRPPKKEESEKAEPIEASDDQDDELEGYSEKVKKRINKLRYEQHEERRRREEAERLREEAVKFAQQEMEKSRKYQEYIQQGEAYVLQQVKEKASLSLEQAKAKYRQAYEEGNTDRVLEAQEDLLNAQSEIKTVEIQEANLQGRAKEYQQQLMYEQQQRQRELQEQQQTRQPVKPSGKALSWSQKNPWFGHEDHKDMTALAYGVHERLVTKEGFAPDSDEYYEAIDRTMRSKFPEYFGEEVESSSTRSPSVVVAPSARNNGAKPRKVRLSRSQISLAKRLGLTPEQYANQIAKES